MVKLVKLGLRGEILNILKSMYSSVKSRVKFDNKLGNEFCCNLGVRQGESLAPLLFSFYLNDIEEQFINSGLEGIDIFQTLLMVGWLVGCFGFNGPLRQYFSLYRAISQREGERGERIDESKNVQTTPTRTYCKCSRP